MPYKINKLEVHKLKGLGSFSEVEILHEYRSRSDLSILCLHNDWHGPKCMCPTRESPR